MCEIAGWDFIDVVTYYFCPSPPLALVHVVSAPPRHTFVVLSLFLFLGVCNFSNLCCHYHPSLWLEPRYARENLRRLSEEREQKKKKKGEEGRKRERKKEKHRGKGKRNVTAEAQRVGGECRRGRTWSWLSCSLQLVSSH